jgi:hypothetical protein
MLFAARARDSQPQCCVPTCEHSLLHDGGARQQQHICRHHLLRVVVACSAEDEARLQLRSADPMALHKQQQPTPR